MGNGYGHDGRHHAWQDKGVFAGITIHTADKPAFFSHQKIEGVLVPPPREDWVDLNEATIIDYMVKPRATGTKGTHSHPVEMYLVTVTVDELRDSLTVSTPCSKIPEVTR